MNKTYRKEGSSLYNCNYIVSFCTKYKRKVLTDEMKEYLKNNFKEISKEYDFSIKEMTISENQIILKIECSPNLGIKAVITKLKNISASKLKVDFPELNSRLPSIWTRESYIVTIGKPNLNDIEEFLKLQKKYEIYDNKED